MIPAPIDIHVCTPAVVAPPTSSPCDRIEKDGKLKKLKIKR